MKDNNLNIKDEASILSDINGIRTRPCPECYLCGSHGRFIYQGLKDRIFGVKGRWNLKVCTNLECELVWMDPMPLEHDIWKAYVSYYTHHENRPKRRPGIFTELLPWIVRQIYSVLKRITLIRPELKRLNLMYLDKTEPGRLLEVGCGNGHRLMQIHALGWEVEGQEIDPKAAEQANSKGLKVHSGGLHDLGLSDNSFDAVIMNHVIEHVDDLPGLLTECRRILKPGGILVAVTPNINSWGHKHFGQFWMGLDPPRHLYLYNMKNLREVAKKSGFDRCELWTTAARAQVISAGSLDIKKRGMHRMGGPLRPDIEAMAMLLQLWAWSVHLFEPDSGEECVLRAVE